MSHRSCISLSSVIGFRQTASRSLSSYGQRRIHSQGYPFRIGGDDPPGFDEASNPVHSTLVPYVIEQTVSFVFKCRILTLDSWESSLILILSGSWRTKLWHLFSTTERASHIPWTCELLRSGLQRDPSKFGTLLDCWSILHINDRTTPLSRSWRFPSTYQTIHQFTRWIGQCRSSDLRYNAIHFGASTYFLYGNGCKYGQLIIGWGRDWS